RRSRARSAAPPGDRHVALGLPVVIPQGHGALTQLHADAPVKPAPKPYVLAKSHEGAMSERGVMRRYGLAGLVAGTALAVAALMPSAAQAHPCATTWSLSTATF